MMVSSNVVVRNISHVVRLRGVAAPGCAHFATAARMISLQSACSPPITERNSDNSIHQTRRNMVTITQTKVDEENKIDESKPVVTLTDSDTPTNNPTATVDDNKNESAVIITSSCHDRLQQLLSKREQSSPEMYLRLYVDAGGCSGFEYKFELDTEDIDEEEDVIVYESGPAKVVIDDTSLQYVQGSTIDYVQEMIKSAFVVSNNPQSESACGCGSSFAVKNFAASAGNQD